MTIHIFRINEADCWATESDTPKAALAECIEEFGLKEEEAAGDMDDEPEEIPEEEFDTRVVVLEDGAQITFREALDRMIADEEGFPRLFASTEY
jgi:hypothetical protein